MSIFLKLKLNLLLFKYFYFIMIDNLISDPTKQILIDLELYFESYKFSNF